MSSATSPAAAPSLVPADHGLARVIGLWPAAMLVVGNVVGSAIFLTTGPMVEVLPSATLILAAWLLGGMIACAGGLTFSEMATMFPRSGGLYVYLEEAYGPLVAYLFGWSLVLVALPGAVAAVAVGFAASFSYFVPALGMSRVIVSVPMPVGTWTIAAGQIVAVASIAGLAAINALGLRTASRLAAFVTVLKVAAVLAIPITALAMWPQSPALAPVVPPVPSPVAAFGIAMIAVMWAYDGWYYLAFAAGEVRDPARTLPRAFILGTCGLTILYLFVNLGYFVALPVGAIAGEARIAEKAMGALVGPWGGAFVAAVVCVSTLGCNLAGILTASRLGFAMAVDGVFFRFAARVHPVRHTPDAALHGLSAWACVLALSGSYEQLFTYVTFATVSFYVLGGLALFRLRRTQPGTPRPYRTWGYPIVPIFFVLGSVALVLNTLFERPVESVAGLSLMAMGLPAYVYWKGRGRAGVAA